MAKKQGAYTAYYTGATGQSPSDLSTVLAAGAASGAAVKFKKSKGTTTVLLAPGASLPSASSAPGIFDFKNADGSWNTTKLAVAGGIVLLLGFLAFRGRR